MAPGYRGGRYAGLASVLLMLAAPAGAQDRFTPEALLDRLDGRTATFRQFESQRLVGVEQFLSRQRTVWARANGSCAYGRVTVEAGQVCFEYDDDPPGRRHCWVPFEMDDRLLVVSPNGGEVQEVTRLSDEPVICSAPPVS